MNTLGSLTHLVFLFDPSHRENPAWIWLNKSSLEYQQKSLLYSLLQELNMLAITAKTNKFKEQTNKHKELPWAYKFYLFYHNINIIILNRYYINMENLGNPYGFLQDSPIVYYYYYNTELSFNQVWTPYAA